ncbi:YybH family protein [Hoeflea prorocentri]|uniref:Nuclear transport factor 2 family protein n=1 Tax=Hoeflea prorocentri TaxID=1922333 RepID=A0A9X3ZJU0_9HYPH|nr:nuclear transport factor 2 family protein [Hoeflea prorocentri]MCY6383160.1 nuclear transport factor 2 family protein [Hoeflea prorocentri]MDA5400960.1 nuclear transport factor 2 family protein [Hoeflea prorocentri]
MSNAKHIARRPREIAECVGAYLKEGDLDGIVSMFHPDCRIYFPPDHPPRVGLAGARQAFKGFIDRRPELKSRIISEVIAGDIALTSASWQVVDPDGGVLAEGQSIEVAKKLDNGGWGYLIDCPNGAPLTEG